MNSFRKMFWKSLEGSGTFRTTHNPIILGQNVLYRTSVVQMHPHFTEFSLSSDNFAHFSSVSRHMIGSNSARFCPLVFIFPPFSFSHFFEIIGCAREREMMMSSFLRNFSFSPFVFRSFETTSPVSVALSAVSLLFHFEAVNQKERPMSM